MTPFAVTWDYRCPFARNAHEHVLDGLAAGAAAWTFRGPLLVFAVAGLTRLPVAPFWQLAKGALVVELVAAFALALLARRTLGDAGR